METVGGRIRALRELKKMSLRDMAERMGMAPSYLSELERGIRRWNEETLRNVADTFGVSVGLLQDSQVRVDQLHEISDLLQVLSGLPPEKLEAPRHLIETMR